MSGRKLLVVVVGPTCSGKTGLAIRLARHYGAPVVSADSRQIYRSIPIGTAQPDAEELSQAEHHMVGFLDLDMNFNCGQYERMALDILAKLFDDHDVVIAAGGSGLYVKALCEGMDDMPDSDDVIRAGLESRLRNDGLRSLVQQLEELDPQYCSQADLNNPQRVVRALEVCLSTGRTYSSFRRGATAEREFDIVKIGIDIPRDILYERINRRVDCMVDMGLVDEARSVLRYRHCNSLRTVGYTELFDYFDGKTTLDEAVEAIKLNTRHYAKRQMTWFRRDSGIMWFQYGDFDAVINAIDSAGRAMTEDKGRQ